jgi:hypothetical protein
MVFRNSRRGLFSKRTKNNANVIAPQSEPLRLWALREGSGNKQPAGGGFRAESFSYSYLIG